LKLDEYLLQEIRVDDKYIDLGKLVEVIDICNFFPIKVKKIKNKSSDIYCILSSNKRDNYDVKESSNGGISDPDLANNLEIIWSIINQKFKKLADAFRFFDMDDNRTIDFIEFFSGLDKLRIKMSESDALKCFKYLNSKKDGEIDYNQFCALVEERRRNIDPFTSATPQRQKVDLDKGSTIDLLNLTDDRVVEEVQKQYLKEMRTDDLDKLLKLQEKLGFNKRKF
jgi:hypothetical protein